MRNSYRFLAFICFSIWMGCTNPILSQEAMPVGVDSVVITFSQAPSLVEVEKAPLKYNKDFALSFQMDDALADIYTIVYPLFEGENNSGGLYYSNGCGQDISFKMTSGIYVFTPYNGTDLLDPDDPWHSPDMLTWNSINTLFQSGWGVVNHGVFSQPQAGSDNERNYEIKRTQSYGRRKINDSFLLKTFIIPNGNLSYVDNIFENHYHSVVDEESSTGWLNKTNDGIDVQYDTINWLHPKKLSRYFDTYYSLSGTANSLYQHSLSGSHRWIPWGMHNYPSSFTADFQYIYNTYGSPGLDNVLISTEDDIVDYLAVKQETQLITTLQGNKLVITFGGVIPSDRLHYDLSLNIYADQTISDIQIYGGESNSSNGINNDTALINLSWDGRYYYPAEYLADSFTTVASSSQTMYDCLVAMDYVLLSEAGTHKDSLRHVLCDINQSGWAYPYEDGFCNFLTVDLGNDTTICSGKCVPLAGPAGMANYEWLANNIFLSSASSIMACPTETTRFTLNVTDVDGTQASDSILITVNPVPLVNLGNDTTLCFGDNLVLYGPDEPQGQTYTYLWSTGSPDDSIVASPMVTTHYYLDVTNNYSCLASDSITLQVSNLPVIDTIVGDTLTCVGDSVLLEVQGSGIESYLWNTDETTQQIWVNPEVGNTNYTFSVEVYNSYGCSVSDSMELFVSNLPVIDTIVGDTLTCLGDSVLLEVQGSDMVTYLWSTGETTPQIWVNPEIGDLTYTFSVEVFNTYGCSVSDSMELFVSSLPVIDTIVGDTLTCLGDSVLLEVQGSGIESYLWNTDETTQQIWVNPEIGDLTYTFSVEVFNNYGCSVHDSIELFVSSLPVIDTIVGDTLSCLGDSILLEVQGSDIETYLWSTGETAQQIWVNPEVGNTNYTFSVEVFNNYGCSVSDSMELFVSSLPVIDTIIGDTLSCLGDSILLEVQGSAIETYLWSTGETAQQIWVNPEVGNTNYTFSVEVFNNYGCSVSDSMELFVSSLPVIDTIVGDTLSCLGDSVLLEVQGSDMVTYLWNTGETTQQIWVNPEIGDLTYTFSVEVFNTYGCSVSDSMELFVSSLPVIDTIVGDTLTCLGDSVLLEVQGSGIESYLWNTDETTQQIWVNPEIGDLTYTFSVEVFNNYGCSVSDSMDLFVSSLPVIDTIVGDTLSCLGDSVLLEVQGSDIVTYLWNTGETTQQIWVNPEFGDSTYTLSVEVFNIYECSASDTMNLFISALPTIDSIVGEISVCPGDSIRLKIFGSGIETYAWNTGDNTQSIALLPEVYDTTYSFLVQVSNEYGCSQTDSIDVKVEKPATVSFPSDSIQICEGDPLELMVNPSNNVTEYRWTYHSTDTTTSFNQLLLINPQWSENIVCTGISDKGCIDIDSTYLQIFSFPEISLSGDTSICSGEPVALTASGASVYYWMVGNDTISTDSFALVSPVDTTVYHVRAAFNDSLCFSDTTLTINVFSMPITKILYDTNVVCENTAVILLAEGADTYLWMPSETTGDSFEFMASDTTEIWLIGTSDYGCVENDSLTINTLPSPQVILSGIFPAYCGSDPPVELIGLPEGGTFFGNGVEDSFFYPQNVLPGIDTLVYTLANEIGCVGYDTVLTQIIGGGETIDLGPSDTTLMPQEELILDAGAGFDSYFWSTGSNFSSITVYGVDNPPGTYEYKVIALLSGCTNSGSINITFYDPDFIDMTQVEFINLYPNPNDGVFSLVLPNSHDSQCVRLFSMQGDLVFESDALTCLGEDCLVHIRLPQLIGGLYTLQLISGDRIYTNKVMIRK